MLGFERCDIARSQPSKGLDLRSFAHRCALCLLLMLPTAAQGELFLDQTGTLLNIKVEKAEMDFGARALLTFDLDYLVRVSTLLGSPVVNCGLRVRNLAGVVDVTLDGVPRRIQITRDNEHLVAILHVGFVMHTHGNFFDFAASGMAFRCSPGVIARTGGQPFNVAGSPGLDRFLCSGAKMPLVNVSNRLPDRLGPDWCGQSGGRYMTAEAARNQFTNGTMRSWNWNGYGGFRPMVTALGLGIARLIHAERILMAQQAGNDTTGLEVEIEDSPLATMVERAAARHARTTAEQGSAVLRMVALRKAQEQRRIAAEREAEEKRRRARLVPDMLARVGPRVEAERITRRCERDPDTWWDAVAARCRRHSAEFTAAAHFGTEYRSGGAGVYVFRFAARPEYGAKLRLTHEFFNIPDRIVVSYIVGGRPREILDTGMVSNRGSHVLPEFFGDGVEITVTGGAPSTKWEFRVSP